VITVYADEQALHDGRAELTDGQLLPCFEQPRRALMIRDRVREVGLGSIVPPEDIGRGPIERVHAPAFVDVLATAWERWTAMGRTFDALPSAWPVRQMGRRPPERIDGLLGWYSFDAATPIMADTWRAVHASAQTALTAARLIADGRERAAFALSRPPGHHAASDLYGGYCFLNNAAIAAQHLLDRGAGRVAILDVDYHHGNGTQAIFYDRPDVLFVSLHAHPSVEFPYFLGWPDETGIGAVEGFNRNYALPVGTAFSAWREALEDALRSIAGYGPDVLVVSLGVDTYRGDPISQFALDCDDFTAYGGLIARLGLPTLFVLEGGYAVEAIGLNTVNVLTGFEAGS
jgi:acetoin utilization deacetylase AcuC-like enzyme